MKSALRRARNVRSRASLAALRRTRAWRPVRQAVAPALTAGAVAVGVVAFATSSTPSEAIAAQAALRCEQWNTWGFFETATIEEVTACLDAGADLAARNAGGYTPLHLATDASGDPVVVEVLLAAGAELEARDSYDNTPLHLAPWCENPAVVEALLAAGADPEARNTFGQTPLYRAAAVTATHAEAAVKALLAAGADPTARRDDGATPLHAAVHAREGMGVVEALLAAGADPTARTDDGDTPLHNAAHGSLAVLQTLLAAGADPVARNEFGDTPLHGAWTPTVVEALLAAGADPVARNEFGDTPLHGARTPTVVEALLAAGADLEARNDDGETPLSRAARGQSLAVLQTLLAAGADSMARARGGYTPLHLAYLHEDSAVIESLLAAGADVMARTEDGDTPLHLAAGSSYEELGQRVAAAIELLLAAGADPTTPNSAGQTPWELVQDNEALRGSDAYWRMNDARFNAPKPDARRGTMTPTGRRQAAAPQQPQRQGPGCEISGFPNPPGGLTAVGLSWCPASVDFQLRAFALQAAGIQCAVDAASPATPEIVSQARNQISEVCGRLAAFGARLGGRAGSASCRCPADYGP